MASKSTTSKQKKPLTERQKHVRSSAQKRLMTQDLVFKWQDKLFSTPCSNEETLQKAAAVLQPQSYAEVVEERSVQGQCGYPLCDQPPKAQQSRYHISLSHRKVYDLSDLAMFALKIAFKSQNITHFNYLKNQFGDTSTRKRKGTRENSSDRATNSKGICSHVVTWTTRFCLWALWRSKKKLRVISSPSLPEQGIHDFIEGFKVETRKDIPSTMTLKKLKAPSVRASNKSNTSEIAINTKTTQPIAEKSAPKEDMESILKDVLQVPVKVKETIPLEPKPEQKQYQKQHQRQYQLNSKTISTGVKETIDTTAKTPPKKKDTPKSTSKASVQENTTNIVVPTDNIIKPKKSTKRNAKTPDVTFGIVWTMLDSMTTQTTRLYFKHLRGEQVDNNIVGRGVPRDASSLLREQIFAEKILETYAVIRSQIGLRDVIENDIADLIRTFNLPNASKVVLEPTQAYMITLVLFKAIADITIKDKSWLKKFEECCGAIGQTKDTIDACARVLVASTSYN
ncbi:hypothetical protein J3Q64DRAFT_1884440 [Phycomyces blakesleeanus]|uniref:RNA polymerase II subunit B1 CTD phosphatase RPAP2 homolog n=1 Tax=Phycomyces blakesleeanus TaxID=4837 RepID=A0ABR3B584_PHYBL